MIRVLLLLVLAWPASASQPTKRLSDPERGEELYQRHCAACHGATNAGDGPATEALVVDVPDLRNQVKVDEATIKLVLRGKGGMPGYETTFDKADAKRVLQHMVAVHQRKPKAAKPKAPAPVDEVDDDVDPEGGDGQ